MQRLGSASRGFVEVVAERADHRPDAIPALQETVDQQAGADVRRTVDMGFEVRMGGNIAGKMMVEIGNLSTSLQQGQQRLPVLVQRDVQHGDLVTRFRHDPLK